MSPDDDDANNPFGGDTPVRKDGGPRPGIFDNGFGDGDTKDPFFEGDIEIEDSPGTGSKDA